MKNKNIVKWIKKWFTLVEVMIATMILSFFTFLWLQLMTDYTSEMINNEKSIYAQRIWSNYMEAIENIRTSAWIDATVDPSNDLNWSVNLARCWWDLHSFIKTDSLTSDLLWWFCKEIPWSTWESFSELNWTYRLVFAKDVYTWEKRVELHRTQWQWNPWNIENFDSYTTSFTMKTKSKLDWVFNEFIDYRDSWIMNERFNWKKLNLDNYTRYFNNNMNIPWRVILVTVSFRDWWDKEVEQFKDSEKEYYKKQIKIATVKVEFWDANQKRKTYVIERVFTNFKS